MEEIFYAVLALHTAGKPINKETIRAILNKAGTQVDEPALNAIAVFAESLPTARQEKDRAVDPRTLALEG
jgi:ribosomal protein L12E/L44/L45/RPP1/RPP2